jgi:F-type H+-transporting ATPase subunit b
MNINLTLIGQAISFAVFVWFCMKFVWPPIMAALTERKKQIADGLAAAEKGQQAEALAKAEAEKEIAGAKEQAAEILRKAEKRGSEIVEEAKADAKVEAERIMTAAQAEIDQELNRAREHLRAQVAGIVISGAQKVIEKEIDEKSHSDLVNKLVAEI